MENVEMAYAFSRINSALGGNPGEEKQDIFAGQSDPQQPGVQGPAKV